MNDTDVFELQFACRPAGRDLPAVELARSPCPSSSSSAKDAGPVVLIHGQEFADAAPRGGEACRRAAHRRPRQRQASAYEAGLGGLRAARSIRRRCDLADIWTIMYTSGTTGRPKGAQITYQMCVFNARPVLP